MLRLSDVLEVCGAVALAVAAGMWDVRALIAFVGLLAVIAGYVLGNSEVTE